MAEEVTYYPCYSYGTKREQDFPNSFFCHGCSQLENELPARGHPIGSSVFVKKGKTVKRFLCTAYHTHPTQPNARIGHHTLNSIVRPTHPADLRRLHRDRNPKNTGAPKNTPKPPPASAVALPNTPPPAFSPKRLLIKQLKRRLETSEEKNRTQKRFADGLQRELHQTKAALKAREKLLHQICSQTNLSTSQIVTYLKKVSEHPGVDHDRRLLSTADFQDSPVQCAYELYRLRHPHRKSTTTAKEFARSVVKTLTYKPPPGKEDQTSQTDEMVMFRDAMKMEVSKYYHQEVLTPRRILRLLDLEGGGFMFSFRAIHLLRKLDSRATGKKKTASCFPSLSALSSYCQKVNGIGQQAFPIELLDGKEGFYFDLEKLIPTLLTIYGLSEKAKQGNKVEIVLSGDGAQLTNRTQANHVTCFLKIVDEDAVDPITGEPLRLHEEEGKAQSRDLVFPIFCMIGKDNEQTMLEYIRPVYEKLQKVCADFPMNDGVVPIAGGPFLLRYGADMKWLWQCLRKGGGCKNVKDFCSFCHAHRDTAIVPNELKCANCCVAIENEDDYLENCYHIARDMEEDVDGVEEDIGNVCQSIGGDYIDEMESMLGSENRLRLPLDGQADDGLADPNCVNFNFSHAAFGDKIIFGQRLQSEIAARPGMNVQNMSMASQVVALRGRMKLERKLSSLKKRHSAAKTRVLQFYDRNLAVTCILHLELRLGEMMVGVLVKRGMAMAMAAVEGQGQGASKRVQKEFLSVVNSVIQGEVLASVNKKSEFTIRFAGDGEPGSSATIAKIGFKKSQARKMVENAGLLIDTCFPEDSNSDMRERLHFSLQNYSTAMEVMRKRTNYTDDEIKRFQIHVDEWFSVWINEFGSDTYSNYMHMMHSGHIAEEMRLFRCLYRYSQEGLEAMNALIKSYFFRRTPRGGGKGEQAGQRVLPIGRWVQRRWCWLALGYIERYEKETGEPFPEREGCPLRELRDSFIGSASTDEPGDASQAIADLVMDEDEEEENEEEEQAALMNILPDELRHEIALVEEDIPVQ